jgi:hypothetical protein
MAHDRQARCTGVTLWKRVNVSRKKSCVTSGKMSRLQVLSMLISAGYHTI